MENNALLLSENRKLPLTKVTIVNGCFVFRENSKRVGMHTIRNMVRFVNTILEKYPGQRLPVIFELQAVQFIDKLTYVLFECLCDFLIENYGYKVKVVFSPVPQIHTAGITSSPLFLLTTGRDEHISKFVRKFHLDIYRNHYRRVLSKKELSQPDFLCKIMDDIATFQIPFAVDDECRDAISEVIIELIGNASEHGDSNCLVDFDIAPSYRKAGSVSEFVGINITIVNFSNRLLGTSLRKKILSDEIVGTRYELVKTAYSNHKKFFSRDYCEDDFFNMTAFQHKISGRYDSILTGGTGLTKLIKSLEARSDAHMCYVLSGDRFVVFKPEYLSYDEEGWLGFNDNNDYFESIPDISIFGKNSYLLPGTAFNLNFVLEKEN